MKKVFTPNLPDGKVLVAISEMEIPGVLCIKPVRIPVLPQALQCHADLQICHLGGKFVLSAPEAYSYYKEKLKPLGFSVLCGEREIGSTYPDDSAYNIARVGDAAFHNPKITDPVALRFFKENGISLVPIKQGYGKCAILPLDAKTIVTQDSGIEKSAAKVGFTVLKISPGGIFLPGFSYGFLGGAAGKTDRDTVYVTGKLSAHPDYEKMKAFFAERGIKIQEGRIPNPVDIGSILPLMTE